MFGRRELGCFSNSFSPNTWDFDDISKYSVDDTMESSKQAGNVQCSVCKRSKEMLIKREELVWQREDMIHIREKELREWELDLEEKNKVLLEKEKQLNSQEENIGKMYSSEENDRKTSITNTDNTFSNPENENNVIQNELLLQKERIILEKAEVISEMIENVKKREQNILSKEKLLEDENSVINKERELIVERNHELDLREKIIKDAEKTKLDALFDDRIEFVKQKQNALSMASEIVQNKERDLNERENLLIEKEKNIFTLINSLNKKYILKEGLEEESKLFEKLDKIFNDRTRILQEREKTISKNELIIEDKWKNYYKAKDLMKSEEGNLKAMKDTFEKEKKMLREWAVGKLFQKQKNKTLESCENSVEYSACSSSQEEQVLQSFANSNINTFNRDEENSHYQSGTPDSECTEISGTELFQLYEKEKKLVHNSLLKENVGMSEKDLKSDHTGNMLNETVQAFFNKVCVNGGSSDVKSASEESGRITELSESMSVNNRNENNIVHEISTQNDSDKLDVTINSTLKSTDILVSGSNSDEGRKETCKQQAKMSTSASPEDKSKQQIEINSASVNKDKQVKKSSDGDLQKCVNPCILQKEENKNNFRNTNGISLRESEREKRNDDSSVVNIDLDTANRASRSSSVCSIRSQSSVSGRNSPWLSNSHRNPNRKALLEAIKARNLLDIVKILDSNCVSLELRNSDGQSALLLAVDSGNIELVQRLITMGADISVCDYNGNSALHIAVIKNNEEMVLTLLKNGARLGVTNNDGKTALQIASKNKYLSIVGVLYKHILK